MNAFSAGADADLLQLQQQLRSMQQHGMIPSGAPPPDASHASRLSITALKRILLGSMHKTFNSNTWQTCGILNPLDKTLLAKERGKKLAKLAGHGNSSSNNNNSNNNNGGSNGTVTANGANGEENVSKSGIIDAAVEAAVRRSLGRLSIERNN